MKPAKNSVAAVDGLYRSVRKVIEEDRKVVSVAANAVLVRQNWSIGKLIVEDEQKGRRKAEYGNKNMFAAKYSTVMPSDEILCLRIAELFKAACRSLMDTGGALSQRDQRRAGELVATFRESARRTSPEVLRAALLACLRELEERK